MDILNTGISNIIDIKATNKTRQVQTAWAGPVWRWLRTTASRLDRCDDDCELQRCTSEWYAVNYRGCNSKSNDGCDHQPLDRCGDGCELPRLDQ